MELCVLALSTVLNYDINFYPNGSLPIYMMITERMESPVEILRKNDQANEGVQA